jgi:hypothetical protein
MESKINKCCIWEIPNPFDDFVRNDLKEQSMQITDKWYSFFIAERTTLTWDREWISRRSESRIIINCIWYRERNKVTPGFSWGNYQINRGILEE